MDAKSTLDCAAMSTIANTANTVIQNLYQTQNVQKNKGLELKNLEKLMLGEEKLDYQINSN